jgi:hypothetical protein
MYDNMLIVNNIFFDFLEQKSFITRVFIQFYLLASYIHTAD